MHARLTGALGFVLLLTILRLVFLLGALDPSQAPVNEIVEMATSRWPGGPERPLYDREELYTATAGEALRLRTGFPVTASQFMSYGSGTLLLSLLTIPIFAVFGPHYLAYKLIALALAAFGGLVWFLLVRQWAGKRSAWCFGLLYALAPPALLRTSLIAKGDHAEAMLLVGVVLYLATRALSSPAESLRRRWAAASGLAVGFGVFFTYSTVPPLAGAGIAALALTRARPRRVWLWFAAGLLVGLIPWLIQVFTTSGEALRIYGSPLGATQSLAEAAKRFQLLISRGFLASYDLPGNALPALAAFAWMVLVVAGWINLARDFRRPFACLALAATATYLLAFCLRAPDASSRYLAPGYPLLLIAAASLAAPRRPRGVAAPGAGAGRMGWIACAVVGAFGLFSQLVSVADSRFPPTRASLAGTDWPLLGEIAGQKLQPQAIRRLPEPIQRHFWVGYGVSIFGFAPRTDWETAIEIAGDGARARVWEGVGIGWSQGGPPNELRDYLATLAPADREAMRIGFARYLTTAFAYIGGVSGPAGARALLESFPAEDRSAFGLAAAQAFATLATQGMPIAAGAPGGPWRSALAPSISALEASVGREDWMRGVGWSLYRSVSRDRGLRLWTPPRDSWVTPVAEEVRAGRGPKALWEGVALAYQQDLSRRSVDFLLGGAGGSRALGVELQHLTRPLPPSQGALFYRAAGRAVGLASLDPARASSRSAGFDADRWTGSLSEEFREAFLAGLADVRTP